MEFLPCVGTLTILNGAMAFRMSLFRLHEVPAADEGNEHSFFSRFSETQLLTSEWFAVGAGLIVAHAIRANNLTRWSHTETAALYLSWAFVVGRIGFAARSFFPRKSWIVIDSPVMTMSYFSTFILGAMLLLL